VRLFGGKGDSGKEPEREAGSRRRGMNDPCWCGSGRKYRNCHLYEDYKRVTCKVPLNEHG
jgi:hypothetical protein